MEKGFSIIYKDNKIVKSVNELKPNAVILKALHKESMVRAKKKEAELEERLGRNQDEANKLSRLIKSGELSKEEEASKVEQDLLKKIPKKYHPIVNHVMVLHGRYVCSALRPKCENCPVAGFCPYTGKSTNCKNN